MQLRVQAEKNTTIQASRYPYFVGENDIKHIMPVVNYSCLSQILVPVIIFSQRRMILDILRAPGEQRIQLRLTN